MAVRLDHTIVPSYDGEGAARWLSELFGLDEPSRFGGFWQVSTDNGVDLDFDTYGPDDGTFAPGHLAFLVDDDDFDAIFARLRAAGAEFWADPRRHTSGEINHHDGGRGVYFASPDDHLFEIITVPYGG